MATRAMKARRDVLLGYPIPDEAKSQPDYIEGAVPGGGLDGDRHLLIVDRDNWLLYETGATRWNARPASLGGELRRRFSI